MFLRYVPIIERRLMNNIYIMNNFFSHGRWTQQGVTSACPHAFEFPCSCKLSDNCGRQSYLNGTFQVSKKLVP